ncbi:MAG: hypothetical protein MOGMAGMI_00286 [Candidatus Omnitrophica bacterium]|nr:hypothetical protein [Candidatus Omnitrophota bacterium]
MSNKIISLLDLVEKGGKAAEVGAIRVWQGQKVQKQADGSWKYVTGEKAGKELAFAKEADDLVEVGSLIPKPIKKVSHIVEKEFNTLANNYHKWWIANKKNEVQGKTSEQMLKMQELAKKQLETFNTAYGEPFNIKVFFDGIEKHGEKTEEYVKAVDKFKQEATEAADNPNKLDKSIVSVDQQGSAIETSSFAIDLSTIPARILQYFYNTMEGYKLGELPREIYLNPDHTLFLVSTDDGLYSGYVVRRTEESFEKIGKVEKQTIPTIIQFLLAKEYLSIEDFLGNEELPPSDELEPLGASLEETTINEVPQEPKLSESQFNLANNLINLLNKII